MIQNVCGYFALLIFAKQFRVIGSNRLYSLLNEIHNEFLALEKLSDVFSQLSFAQSSNSEIPRNCFSIEKFALRKALQAELTS